jgi:hypothetical protein
MLDLDGDGVDQPQAGVQPGTCGGGQLELGQPAAPGRAEQGPQLGDDAQVGQQGMELGCTRERIRTRPARVRTSRRASRAWGGAIQASASRLVRNRWARVLASTASFLTRAAEIALVASGWGHVGRDAGVGQQVREPAPAVGGLEGDLDRLGLELAEDAQELGRGVADPSGQHDATDAIQGDHV